MLELVGLAVSGVASIAFLVAYVWVLVIAFKESPVWGVGSFLCGPINLIFALIHVRECKRPLLLGIASIVVFMGAGLATGLDVRSRLGGRRSFDASEVELPELPTARGTPQTPAPGVLRYEVPLGPDRDGYYDTPGHGGRLLLYLPEGQHAPGTLPCLLVAPGGTYGYDGMLLTIDDEPEHVPYVAAGFAVVAYELDGPLDAPERTDATFDRAYAAYSAAQGGLANAHIALEYVLARVPEVDPRAIYAAGHSSAGSVAFTVAANEPRLTGVIAYAPRVDYVPGLASLEARERRRLASFARLVSPLHNAPKVRQPVFLFQAKDDSRCPYDEALALEAALRRTNPAVTLAVVDTGDHRDSMLEQGIPAAIAWLQGRHPQVKAPLAAAIAPAATQQAQATGAAKLLREAASDDPTLRAQAVADWVANGYDREDGARLAMLQALGGVKLDGTIDRNLARSMKGSAMTPQEVLDCLPLAPPLAQRVLLARLTAPGVTLPREKVVAVLAGLTDDRELHVEEALVLFGAAREGCGPRLADARGEEWPLSEEGRRTLAALPTERVLELAASEDAPHRVLGARLLAARGPDVALAPLTSLVRDDPAAVVRQEVALLLETMKDARAAPGLARALRGEKDESARARIRRTISVLPAQGASKELIALLARPEAEERLAAITGLEALSSADGVRPLAGALLDPDRSVAIAACRALEALRASRVPGVPDLVNQQAREIGKASTGARDEELKRLARHLYFQIRGRLPEQDGLR